RASSAALPINFACPRQPKPPRDPGKRLLVLVGGGLFAFAVMLLALGLVQLSSKNRKLAALQKQKNELDNQLHVFEPDAKRIKSLDDWSASEVNWLDELYDMTARVPDINKIRIINFSTSVIEDPSGKKKQVAAINLKGINTNDNLVVDKMMNDISLETSYRFPGRNLMPNTTVDRFRFPQAFTTRIELEKRPPDKYTRSFTATPPPKRQRPAMDGGAGLDAFGGIGGVGP